jgi:catechol 2,3-dioxygenase-like lactoylglutathione lyase family enzyme
MRPRFAALPLAGLAFAAWLGAAPPTDDLASLAFLSGAWSGAAGEVAAEEMWTAPAGGTMLAVHRDIAGGRTVSFEFLRIEAAADGITYWASPQGKPATPFRLVESARNRVVFENPEHVYPRRIVYWLGDDGSLKARIEGMLGGKPASEQWSWRRSP